MRIRSGIACIALAVLLGGCGAPTRITGKVIEGEISFVGAIDASDDRLSSVGLEGASVTLSATGDQLAKAASDAKGDFRVSLADFNVLSAPLDFVVTREGYATARGSLFAPPSDRRILVVLKRTGGSGTR